MKAYRERIRSDPARSSEKKGKDRDRKRTERQKSKEEMEKMPAKIQEQLLATKRAKYLKWQNKCRMHRRVVQNEAGADVNTTGEIITPTKVYPTRQSAAKAVQRLRVKLPFSPRKRQAITLKLAIEEGNKILKSPRNRSREGISEETKEEVSAFFSRDDISWAAPGMRDSAVVRLGDGAKAVKTVAQKRYLTMNIIEAYQIFKKENLNKKIGKSKFYELRPKHVLTMEEIPHNVCICKVHGNMESLLEGINKVYHDAPRFGHKLIEGLVCDRESAACMLSTCQVCSKKQFLVISAEDEDSQSDEDDGKQIKWRRWEEVSGRPIQLDVLLSGAEACCKVNDLLNEYKAHCFIKDQQSKYFKHCKVDIDEGQAILQVDFAENYATVSQDEQQSAHWNHSQVTVFTAVAWLKDECKSFAVVSDDLDHDKYAVWAILKVILHSLKHENMVSSVKIFSDGCAAQFKNRY